MTLENDMKQINTKLDSIDCKTRGIYDGLPGFGLYAMVFFTFLQSCDALIRNDVRQTIREELANDRTTMQVTESPRLVTRNVLGNQEPEQFYEINGQRTYVQIDGKPIEEYLGNPAEAPYIGQ